MTNERRIPLAWYIKALQNAIIPILGVAAMAYLTLDRVGGKVENHVIKTDIHMTYKEKLEEFVHKPLYKLHLESVKERFDKLDQMQMRIFKRLGERRREP